MRMRTGASAIGLLFLLSMPARAYVGQAAEALSAVSGPAFPGVRAMRGAACSCALGRGACWHDAEARLPCFSAQAVAVDRAPSGNDRSPKKAFFLSLILPGAGQWYVGGAEKARAFLGLEGTLWGLLLGLRTFEAWREDDCCGFAKVHAHTDAGGQSDHFLVSLESYASAWEYNRFAQATYGPDAVLYEGHLAWEWDSDAARAEFVDLRRSSWQAHTRATYVLGGLLFHRIVSAIHAARMVGKGDEACSSPGRRVQIGVTGPGKSPGSLGLRVTMRL